MNQSEGQRLWLRRRDFLVLGAAASLVPWTSGLAQAETGQDPRGPAAEPMSVGYLNGSDGFPVLGHLPWNAPERVEPSRAFEVVSATDLTIGDQELAGADVRITIHGIYPSAPAACMGVDSIDLDVLFPNPEPALSTPIPFMAWSFRRRPGVNVSPPVSFQAPLGVDGGLELSLRSTYRGEGGDLARRVLQGSPFIQRSYRTNFTVDWQTGRPKLQRGVYLLGVRPDVWRSGRRLPVVADRARASDLCSVVLSVEPIAAE